MTIKRSNIKTRSLACTAISVLLFGQASAQIHTPFQPGEQHLFLAEQQLQQGHYRMAVQSAQAYLNSLPLPSATLLLTDQDRMIYERTLAQLKVSAPGVADSAVRYMAVTADPARKQRVAFALANYYFRNNLLGDAIPYYELAGIENLSNREIADAKFELAYCYFNQSQFEKAESLFATIKEVEGKYYNAGNYYYGLLAYNKGNFPDALKSFQRIADHADYRSIVPYYIAEIYYFTGDKKKALSEALRLIKQSDKLYYDNELHLLAAQCLFEEQKYQEALPYFEHFYDQGTRIRKEELYEMGYCYYRVSQWSKAIERFKPLSGTNDSLGQTAMYLLGDCYLKINDKKSARTAYGLCADMSFNPAQQEAALLLAAKLSYEMGYNDDAERRVRTLLSQYPDGAGHGEAKVIYSDLLIKSSNYPEAYRTLADVPVKDANYWNVLQKVAYGYGLEQMRRGDLGKADELLAQSLQQPTDPAYEAAAWFWRGELAYRRQQYPEAITYTQNFLNRNSNARRTQYLSTQATEQHGYMNLGYASMKTEEFSRAQAYFAKAQQGGGGNSILTANAVLREADAAFMARQYSQAVTLYDKAINNKVSDLDYARYQKAILLGLLNNNAGKVTLLQSIISQKPVSPYEPNARYELAVMSLESGSYQNAINLLMPLTNAEEGRSYTAKAWLKIGFAYQQLKDQDKATVAYKHVVTEYAASEERPAAMEALRNIYIDQNQPESYAQLLTELNMPAENNSALDSTYYAAAQAQFSAGRYEKARDAFGAYLKQYPNGAFSVKANYYKGESHSFLKENKEALVSYNSVLESPWNDFTENSALKAGTLAYQSGDNTAAQRYYGLLRSGAMDKENLQTAYAGLMKTSFNLSNYTAAINYADTLLSLPDVPETLNTEGQYIKAKALLQQNRTDEANNLFIQLENARDNNIAAEARYRTALTFFNQNRLKEAEDKAVSNLKSGSDYWVVKTYVLLADIALKQKDYFNAKATLQSVVNRTKFEDVKREAAQKLEEVKALEKKQSKLSEE